MTFLIAGIAVLVAVLFFFNWWGKRPVQYRLNVAEGDYRKYLEVLLYRGYDQAFLIIEAQDQERFIQFTKYRGAEKYVGLECDFPRAPWLAQYLRFVEGSVKATKLRI